MNRPKISVVTLVAGLLFLHISSSIAQTCAIPPAASDNCINAPEMSCNLDGYSGTTAGFTASSVPNGFCGMIENNQFLSFRADESPVIFNITPSNCTTAQGIQAMIYDANGCSNLVTISNCGSTGFETTITVTAPVVIIGKLYHLMIDGYKGDICDYTINVIRGIQSDVEAKGQDVKICKGTNINLDATGSSVGENVVYSWESSNGGQIVSGETTLTPMIDAIGDYTLTVVDTLTCCRAQQMIKVTEDTNYPQVQTSVSGVINCNNPEVVLDGTSNDAGDFSYQWFGDNVAYQEINQPYDISVSNQSTYSLIATNNDTGCTAISDVVVVVDTIKPELLLATDGILSCAVKEVNLDISSPTTDISYTWDGLSVTGLNESELVIENAGLYTVVATAPNGCTNTASTTVQVDTIQPSIEVYVLDELDCKTSEVFVIGNSDVVVDYNWSGPNNFTDSSFDLTVEEPGIYDVEITAANGCKNTTSVEVVQNIEVPELDILPLDKLTCTNKMVSIEPQVGLIPLSYDWTLPNGSNLDSPSINANQEGNYSLIITSENGCTNNSLVIVEQDTIIPIIETNALDKLTCTNSEVQLTSTITNNTSTYDYEWLNESTSIVGTTSSVSQTEAGIYQVITTDIQNGCTNNSFVSIEQDTIRPIAVATPTDTLTCIETSVLIDGSNSSAGNQFSYVWANQNNQLLGSSNTLSVTSSESYQLVVTDNSNGCTSSISTQVPENKDFPSVEITSDSILTCTNQTIELKSTQMALSGLAEYEWGNENGNIIATNSEPEIAMSGVYHVTVTDTWNGCTTTESIEIIEDKEVPVFVANTPAVLTCTNTNSMLSFDATNPVSEFSIQWMDINGVDLSTDQEWSTNAPGMYTLQLTNEGNGCSSDAMFTVTQNTIAPYADTTLQATINCFTQNVELNIGASSSGTQMNYQWIDTNENVLSENENIELSSIGNYQLVVTDTENGCTNTADFTINEDFDQPEAEAGEDALLTCFVNEIDLGTNSLNSLSLSYEWLNSSGITVGSNPSLVIDHPDTYQLITTDLENGCTNSDDVIVSESINKPAFSIAEPTDINCYETPVMLTSILENMEELYTYKWTNSANVEIATTKNVQVTDKGTYKLEITNEVNKCTEERTVEVEENKNIPEAIAGEDGWITCNNPFVALVGSSPTTSSLEFAWLNEQNEIESSTPLFEATTQGEYSLVVTNIENGCSQTDAVLIQENIEKPAVSINSENDLLTCTNTVITLNAETDNSLNAIQWQSENGMPLSVETSIEVTNSGEYELIITDAINGCTETNSIQIVQNIVEPTIAATTPTIINCINETAMVELQGESSYLYQWINENGNQIGGQTTNIFETNAIGMYQVEITDADNGCTKIASFEVEADLEKPVAIAHVEQELNCVTESVILDGFDSSVGNQFSYEWTGNSILSGQMTLNPEVAEAGEYSLQVTDIDNGCVTETSINVLENTDRPTSALLQTSDPVCHEDANGMVQINDVIGGAAPYLFNFENTSFTANPNLNNLSEGTYELRIQDAIGCEWDTVFQLISPSEVSVDLGEDALINLGQSIVLQAETTGDIQLIEWESGDGQIETTTLPSLEVAPTQTTTYEIYIEDENGCLDSDFITIQVEKDRDVYIPNAFSPNGDGVNDLFQIYTVQEVEQVISFQVFDRWGNLVFTQNNFSPSDANHGWDGNFRNQKMQPSVYVYVAEVEFIDGKSEIFKGDVTILY